MKYYQPRYLDGGFVFGFTEEQNTKIRRTGYCALFDHAHHTPEDAIACFREYLLNAATDFNRQSDTETYCCVCNRRTMKYAYVKGICRAFSLCDDHQNTESVDKLLVFSGYFATME